jgi:hypothetical protein
MKYIWYNIVTLIAVLIAGVLVYQGKEGWGWFLFVAFCFGVVYPKTKNV